MSIETLLSHLHGVRQTGPANWMTLCTVHPDKHPSLSVRELEDGRILLHCFAGCSTADVLAAVGLEFSDLYPPKPLAHHVKPERRPFPALDVLKALTFEATVVLSAARELLDAGDLILGAEGFNRLALATDRIESALALVEGGRRHD